MCESVCVCEREREREREGERGRGGVPRGRTCESAIERKETVFSSFVMSWYRPFKFDSTFDTEKRKQNQCETKTHNGCVQSIVRLLKKQKRLLHTRERVLCICLLYFILFY